MLNKEKELPVTKCTRDSFNFPELKKRTVEVNFEGGDITSDGGVMLISNYVMIWRFNQRLNARRYWQAVPPYAAGRISRTGKRPGKFTLIRLLHS